MIIFELECMGGHRFEGWFATAQSFEEQTHAGMVQCAVCGISEVRRIPSGGHVAKPEIQKLARRPSPSKSPNKPRVRQEAVANVDPVMLVKALDHYVKTNFKDVGKEFAKEALAIHQGVSPKEAIYGTATAEEREMLETEDVPFSTLPKLPETLDN